MIATHCGDDDEDDEDDKHDDDDCKNDDTSDTMTMTIATRLKI